MPHRDRALSVAGMDITPPARTVGLVGLAAFVLLFTGVNLQDVGGSVEPSFDAPASEVSQFLASRNPAVFPIASYATVLGLIAFLWFAAGLASVLRPALPDRDWMPGVVLASGAAVAATVLAGSWEIGRCGPPGGGSCRTRSSGSGW
jgi:hypothetical protein